MRVVLKLFSGGCSFRRRFKMYCPGCGGTRALVALLNGNIIESLRYNPLTLLFIIDVVLMTFFDIYEKRHNKKLIIIKIRLIYNVSLLVIIVLIFIIRNYLLLVLNIDVLGDFQ